MSQSREQSSGAPGILREVIPTMPAALRFTLSWEARAAGDSSDGGRPA